MQRLNWSEIPGWGNEDHAAVWPVFAATADRIGLRNLPPVAPDARVRFEALFAPWEVVPPGTARFTGYFEPEIPASLTRSPRFTAALYGPPPGLRPGQVWFTRAEIVSRNLLAGRELAWVETPVEAFFAQLQGAVRLRLEDGSVMRLGFAGKNNHPFRAPGRFGNVGNARQSLHDWCLAHPAETQATLNGNPSFIFFRKLDLPPMMGPIGAAGQPIMAGRSISVDPRVIRLGSPVWVDCPGFGARLTIAQDAGTAIRGAGRGDLFLGSGAGAGLTAAGLAASGRMIVLRVRA